jgi:Xaa-Pro aminopeptidase
MSCISNELASRRQYLTGKMRPNSIAIIPSAIEKKRSRDTYYPFRQNNYFLYLSHFLEPESVIVLLSPSHSTHNKIASNSHLNQHYLLFCRERNPKMEVWHGRRFGIEGALKHFQCDAAYSINDIAHILQPLLKASDNLYYDWDEETLFDLSLKQWLSKYSSENTKKQKELSQQPLKNLIDEMRLFKSPFEIEQMRKATKITEYAHHQAMKICQPDLNECDIEAEIKYHFIKSGSSSEAYPSIIAGGNNACILHYIENNARLKNNELLLIDAGAEINGYASDITRTFPINGRFSSEQKEVYMWVLKANKAAIQAAVEGALYNDPHHVAVRILTQGLIHMEIITGDLELLIKAEAYKPFYMHKTGHWIGLDVHDVGDYTFKGASRKLKPNMTLTIEPGLYFSSDMKNIDPKWHGIGIRIEDDILITPNGNEVLSKGIRKEILDIEVFMSKESAL